MQSESRLVNLRFYTAFFKFCLFKQYIILHVLAASLHCILQLSHFGRSNAKFCYTVAPESRESTAHPQFELQASSILS